ncbi:TAXI family TRAP transporter solute-binding subunit [Nocardioides hwasunensis]|uniref:TAXI family TRAP transporter solute-binding subunit n=1 Tax=Nocardioides hwasunensis TaxID=397258 RepID=A0ABR8MI78_9ACTN|nr:TAXI family TRAP transporter solute-binding subunit [Nocardioides hwasunensis]MBD3914467.1 TAXI family TRAP transporter solute-binding subunit [Nocardioides hwasunensis]
MPPPVELDRRGALRLGGLGFLGVTTPFVAACSPRLPAPRALRLATGPPGAVFREVGRAFAPLLEREWPGCRVRVDETAASSENADLLVAGEADLGFVNVDVAREHRGDLTALARVFDSVLHVVVAQRSDVRTFADLDGRPVAAGLRESGSRYLVDRLVDVTGVRPVLRSYTQEASVRALREGSVEAAFSLTGMPTPAVRTLATTTLDDGGGTRLLDLGRETRELERRYPEEYFTVTIPSSMYPPLSAATTLTVPSLLACRSDLPLDVARTVARVLMEHAPELSDVRPEAGQINARTASSTVPVSLHPGAADYFRSAKP